MQSTFTVVLLIIIYCGCKCKAYGFRDDCGTGYYRHDSKCKSCSSNCVSCSSNNICEKCENGYYTCNLYSSNICRACSNGCTQCTNKTHCLNCSEGYFKNGNTCTKCLSQCKTCTSIYSCQTCSNGFILRGSSCQKCREGYFESRGSCKPCLNNCASCSVLNECTSCKQGFFGKICNQKCPRGCKGNICEQIMGYCLCKENYVGYGCNKYKPQKYRPHCKLDCPKQCVTCDSNESCDVCFTGSRELKCNCSNDCLNNECDTWTCQCRRCKPNFKRPCLECVNGKWGQTCTYNCPVGCLQCLSETNCTKCEDGYSHLDGKCLVCSTNCFNASCNSDSGVCDRCKPGYWGIFCNESCSKNCLSGICHNKNGSCILVCRNGYHGYMCNCPNNCICNSSGQCLLSCRNSNSNTDDDICDRQCNSMCLNCSQHTGKCERCSNNTVYGDLCDKECSSTCIDRRCDTLTGRCTSGCTTGYFGDTCSKQCSSHCLKLSCNRETGYCDFEKTDTDNNLLKVADTNVILLAIVAVLLIYAIITTVVLIRKRSKRRTLSRQPEVNSTLAENVDNSYQPLGHRNAAYSDHAYALPDVTSSGNVTSSGSMLLLEDIGPRSSSYSSGDRRMYIHPVYAENTVRREYVEIKQL